MNPDGRTTSVAEEKKLINILPGFDGSTELRFTREGNQAPDQEPSDLVIKIAQLPHTQFKRVKNDLIYTAQINLIDAISCVPIHLVTLDGRELYIPMDKIIQPNKSI